MISDLKRSTPAKPTQLVDMRVAPTHWWSGTTWNVFEDELLVTSIDLRSWFQSRVKFEFDLYQYEILREWRTAELVLRRDGEALCRAKKRLLRRSFIVRYDDAAFTFEPRSAFDRTFVLSQSEDEQGWVSPRGIFQNWLAARLPKQMPLEVRVFVMWLVFSTMPTG